MGQCLCNDPYAWWPNTWEINSWRQHHSRALDDEELFIIEVLLLLFLTKIDEPAMSMSIQLYDLIGNPGAESPRSKTPGDSGTTGTCD